MSRIQISAPALDASCASKPPGAARVGVLPESVSAKFNMYVGGLPCVVILQWNAGYTYLNVKGLQYLLQ